MASKMQTPKPNQSANQVGKYYTFSNIMRAMRKVFKSEIATQFTVAIIIGLIIATVIPMITPLARGKITSDLENEAARAAKIAQDSANLLTQTIGTAVLYSLIVRLLSIFRERTTVDRNRALYLKYDKHTVLFGKSVIDVSIFILPVIAVIILGSLVMKFKNDATFPADFAGNMVVYAIAVLMMYAVMSFGIRFCLSSINNKEFRGVAIGVIIIGTAGLYIVLSIVGAIVSDVRDIILNNKYIFSFVPFINVATFPFAISGALPAWTMVPFIVEMFIIIGVMWKPLAKNIKAYLAA